MTRYEAQTTIQASPERVFEYVSDMTKHGEWAGTDLQVTKASDGPAAVGAVYDTVGKQFGTQREQSTVSTMTPGSAFAWDSVGALGRTHHAFELSSDGGGTAVTKTAEIVEPKFLAKLTGFKLSKDIPAGLTRDLERIKAHLEGAS
jgi:uncharacterized protein YndB with AHSA1/START domain